MIPPEILEQAKKRFETYSPSDPEHLIVFSKDGNLVFEKTGRMKEVSVTIPEYVQSFKSYQAHNHPSGKTFSPRDVATMFQTYLRGTAVFQISGNPRYIYTMTPVGEEYFGDDARKRFWEIYEPWQSEHKSDLLSKSDEYLQAQVDGMWQRMDAEGILRYEKTEW